MFENIMSKERHLLLNELTYRSILADSYLAGGTAAALYIGHRWSEDLDFFSPTEFSPQHLGEKLAKLDGFMLTGMEAGTLNCFIKNVKVSFLYYPYNLVGSLTTYRDIQLASVEDIALMKMVAMVQRGTKKDFIDLYFLDREQVSFEKMLELYPQKYSRGIFQPMVLLKSMGYFADAEREELPRMFKDVSWENIKKEYLDLSYTVKLPDISEPEVYAKNFKLLLEALTQGKPVRYTNTDKWGNVYRDKLALPINLEYSMRDGRFRLPCTPWMITGRLWPTSLA